MVRPIYDKLRKMNVSTLEVHRCLVVAGVDISKRSVQGYLDTNLTTCKDDRIRKVINAIVDSKNTLIETLKTIK